MLLTAPWSLLESLLLNCYIRLLLLHSQPTQCSSDKHWAPNNQNKKKEKENSKQKERKGKYLPLHTAMQNETLNRNAGRSWRVKRKFYLLRPRTVTNNLTLQKNFNFLRDEFFCTTNKQMTYSTYPYKCCNC